MQLIGDYILSSFSNNCFTTLREVRETIDFREDYHLTLFTMEADILPPNLGRRGSRDRDINPPEPPRD